MARTKSRGKYLVVRLTAVRQFWDYYFGLRRYYDCLIYARKKISYRSVHVNIRYVRTKQCT